MQLGEMHDDWKGEEWIAYTCLLQCRHVASRLIDGNRVTVICGKPSANLYAGTIHAPNVGRTRSGGGASITENLYRFRAPNMLQQNTIASTLVYNSYVHNNNSLLHAAQELRGSYKTLPYNSYNSAPLSILEHHCPRKSRYQSTAFRSCSRVTNIRIVVGCRRVHAGTQPLNMNIGPSFLKDVLITCSVD